jgi:hypothetical protein
MQAPHPSAASSSSDVAAKRCPTPISTSIRGTTDPPAPLVCTLAIPQTAASHGNKDEVICRAFRRLLPPIRCQAYGYVVTEVDMSFSEAVVGTVSGSVAGGKVDSCKNGPKVNTKGTDSPPESSGSAGDVRRATTSRKKPCQTAKQKFEGLYIAVVAKTIAINPSQGLS